MMFDRKYPCVHVAMMVQSPQLAEWWSSTFSLGLGLVLLLVGKARLSLGLLQGPVVEHFVQFGFWYSMMLLAAGLLGVLGLARGRRKWRTTAALIQFACLGWLPVYYYLSVPIPWQGVWVYAAHAALEGIIYVRVRHSLDKGWVS